MVKLSNSKNQIQIVKNFEALISSKFQGDLNAMCWNRTLEGDFSEIINKFTINRNITEVNVAQLLTLQLSKKGQIAREIIINDLKLLKKHGASPIINIIKNYDRDDSFPFFPTDVYSFHVDRSPIPTETFLCTYYGTPSEIIENSKATQKILIPEIREELKKLYDGSENGFEEFLTEYFFDLHYQAKPNAQPINLGNCNLWKLAVDHPESNVLPCIHRAPKENTGENRLLLIC
ncbi:hypothetical protein [Polaribacter ponticola]|uniref:DUF1826 domain-containing protein n=1 Tax=Polaribacter ponticola TaxID=2978475 RepID=A0ABT5S7F0_9FLAO|nr:hypothetical protein [Polaribacter sp. MSW5]MDD7913545.1 hypothetical protein [Polaribacter sp. MSW5]